MDMQLRILLLLSLAVAAVEAAESAKEQDWQSLLRNPTQDDIFQENIPTKPPTINKQWKDVKASNSNLLLVIVLTVPAAVVLFLWWCSGANQRYASSETAGDSRSSRSKSKSFSAISPAQSSNVTRKNGRTLNPALAV